MVNNPRNGTKTGNSTQKAMEMKMLHLSLRDRVRHTGPEKEYKSKIYRRGLKHQRKRGWQKRLWSDDIASYVGTYNNHVNMGKSNQVQGMKDGFIQQWVQ